VSGVAQQCPWCDWARFLHLPQTADPEFDELIARHVARSLQWEWQAHAVREHMPEADQDECLTYMAFDAWVASESDPGTHTQTTEKPPKKGGGKTVRVNTPGITPDQARNLAYAVERTMVSAAEGIQRFADQMVPALYAAQAQLVNGLRDLVDQRWTSWASACRCNGGHDAHQAGADGCLFKPYVQPDDLLASQQRWAERFGAVAQVGLRQDGYRADRPYGTVEAEICGNCQRLAGEPHGLPSCAEHS
jgi:hypothetical protein